MIASRYILSPKWQVIICSPTLVLYLVNSTKFCQYWWNSLLHKTCTGVDERKNCTNVVAPVCDGTQNVERYLYRYFLCYQIFSIPIPVLFLISNFSDTGSKTFFRYQILPIPVLIPPEKMKSSRYREFPVLVRHTLVGTAVGVWHIMSRASIPSWLPNHTPPNDCNIVFLQMFLIIALCGNPPKVNISKICKKMAGWLLFRSSVIPAFSAETMWENSRASKLAPWVKFRLMTNNDPTHYISPISIIIIWDTEVAVFCGPEN